MFGGSGVIIKKELHKQANQIARDKCCGLNQKQQHKQLNYMYYFAD